jgi:hypothetical protein
MNNEIPLSKELSEMSDRELFVRSSDLTLAEKEREPEEMEFMSHKETSNECKATKLANVYGMAVIDGLFFKDTISNLLAPFNVAKIDSAFPSVSSTFSVMMRFCKPPRDDPGKLSELNPLQSVMDSRFKLGSEGKVPRDWILIAPSNCNRFTTVKLSKNVHTKDATLQS